MQEELGVLLAPQVATFFKLFLFNNENAFNIAVKTFCYIQWRS